MFAVAPIQVAVVEVGRNGGIQELIREVRFTGICDLLEREMLKTRRREENGGRRAFPLSRSTG